MDVYVWIVTVCLSISMSTIHTLSCKRETRCRISRIRSMKAADCYNKEITTFPQCLPQDVEIVDLSRNRIRKLSKEDLKKYSNLKMLYLNDNLITVIDKETFDENQYLHTLDLSLNAIRKLPTVLFQIPSLKSLYLGQNLNTNIADVVEKAKPTLSPLYNLDISQMFEEVEELPNFELMPTLEKYNISGNKVMAMNTKHFSGLCGLKILDTANVSLEYDNDGCDCWIVNRWLKNRKVLFKPFICTVDEKECLNEVPIDDETLYQECIQQVKENLRKSKLKTILLIVIPISVLVCLAIIIYAYYVRRKKLKKNKDSAQEIMLNNVLPKLSQTKS